MRLALAGGQDEHPWLVNSSTTTGRVAASAEAVCKAIADARIVLFAKISHKRICASESLVAFDPSYPEPLPLQGPETRLREGATALLPILIPLRLPRIV
jgi:hypothetical protein